MFLTTKKEKEQVAEYVAAGNTTQFSDPRWAEELRSWIRFSSRDAVRTGDGLYGPVMGNPDAPRWLGSLFMRLAFSAKRQNRKDFTHIRSSAAIAVFFSEADDKQHWIEAGRCYERLALQAAALELRTAFINQPVEVPALRSQFASFLAIGSRRPDLVVRSAAARDAALVAPSCEASSCLSAMDGMQRLGKGPMVRRERVRAASTVPRREEL